MNDSTKLISVIIPTYNRAGCVGDAIDSALNQTYPHVEVLLIDDGSTDDTASLASRYGDRIRYIRQDNKGVSAARNLGISEAAGRWIAFLDSDDEWHPCKLEWQAAHAASDERCVAHVTNTVMAIPGQGDFNVFRARGFTALLGEAQMLERPLQWMIRARFVLPTMMVLTDLARDLGGFNRRYSIAEDHDFCVRAALSGAWGVEPRPTLKIVRKTEAAASLSGQYLHKPVRYYGNLVRIYTALASREDLTPPERSLVERSLVSAKVDLADALTRSGYSALARRALLDSIRLAPTLKNTVKCGLPLLCGRLGAAAIRWKRRMTQREFRRTQLEMGGVQLPASMLAARETADWSAAPAEPEAAHQGAANDR